jgi:hypothetical protein
MSNESEEAAEVLRAIWQSAPDSVTELDSECNPNKACRNMKDVSFDGFAEDGVDLGTAWRNKLAREGKLGGGSLADLVFEKTN